MQKQGDEMHKETLLKNIDKIHTTEMGVGRIQKNLGIDGEPVEYCISKLQKEDSQSQKKEKITMLRLITVE